MGNHNSFSGTRGIANAVSYPSSAKFKFGDGGFGEVTHAAGCVGAFTAFVLKAEIPALSRKGALEVLGAQLDFVKDTLSLKKQGVTVPLKVNEMVEFQ